MYTSLMFVQHVVHLVCPKCQEVLQLEDDYGKQKIEQGTLRCTHCFERYPIHNGIPRFVPSDHYTGAFGYQWLKHAKTQYDSFTNMPVSENRIRLETKWPEKTPDEKILEVGSGAGRFTEQLLTKGALIVSFDASMAVEANYAAHGDNPLALIIQADMYNLPFRDEYFDKMICIGVLQHTPDPQKSIKTIVSKVRVGGQCVMDIYRRHVWYRQIWNTRYWFRPLTKHMEPEQLYTFCKNYIGLMWPLAKVITRLPYGRTINHKLLIPELITSKKYGRFSDTLHKEWTILHLFDWLNPTYDQPQFKKTFHCWLHEAGLSDVETNFGYGGIEGRGTRMNNDTV